MKLQKQIFAAAALSLAAIACSNGGEFAVERESAKPASSIDWLGDNTRLLGKAGLETGKSLPALRLVNMKMQPESLQDTAGGKVLLVSVVPSLDTEVCDEQTHILGESKKLSANVVRVTVSRDLPYAIRRFSEKSGLENIIYLSDYSGGALGSELGLEVERNGLLARAVFVVDKNGVIRHSQIVPKIYALPDMERAIEAANRAQLESGG